MRKFLIVGLLPLLSACQSSKPVVGPADQVPPVDTRPYIVIQNPGAAGVCHAVPESTKFPAEFKKHLGPMSRADATRAVSNGCK